MMQRILHLPFLLLFCAGLYGDGRNGVIIKDVRKVSIEGTSALPLKQKIEKRLGRFVGKPLYKSGLEEIRQYVVKFYQDAGYPIVYVSIPKGQEVSRGEIRLVILVGKVGKVKVEGARYFSNEKLLKKLEVKPGEFITTSRAMDDLAYLNSNPYRNASVIYEKGEKVGETDVVFTIEDKRPLRMYGGYENTGNIVAGDSRFLTGMSFGNLFDASQQLDAQFFSAPNFNSWWGTGGSYVAPLWWHHRFRLFGSYVKTRPSDLHQRGLPPPMTLHGKGWQISGRYIIPLHSIGYYRHSIMAGYDFKRTNNFLAYSDALIFRAFIDVSQFLVNYEGVHENSSGMTVVGGIILASPGNMTAFNHNRNFEQERPGAKCHYAYGRISVDRYTRLPAKFMWMVSSLIQLTGSKLLPSEELSSGGFLSVRGYDENEIISDRGLIVRNEIRCPPFSGIEFLAFADFAYANDVDRNIFDKNNTILASVGPGVRYKYKQYVDFHFDYGFQLKPIHPRPFAGHARSRMHLGLIVGF